jgi:hypothetical protein
MKIIAGRKLVDYDYQNITLYYYWCDTYYTSMQIKIHIILNILKKRKMLGVLIVSSPGVLLTLLKYDLRKNKIIVASTTFFFLSISTKFEALTPNL